MGLRFENLDEETRRLMIEEIDLDVGEQSIYLSNYLNEQGRAVWPALTREAARIGSDDSLARDLANQRLLKSHTERRKPTGGVTMAKVPYTAPQTLAEAQFGLYYVRALARRAIGSGSALEVYRAKEVERPRAESEQMIGTEVDPQFVLDELRRTKGVNPATGIPLPNSGLCVRLPKK